MNIGPILSTLRKHKTATVLIVLEIAIACAILCNAVFLVSQRVVRMTQPSGIEENRLVMITSIGLDPDIKPGARIAEDTAALRAIPGVEAVTNVNQFPFASNSWVTDLKLKQDQEKPSASPSLVIAGDDYQPVSGLKIKQGRWFSADEFRSDDLFSNDREMSFPVTVLSEALAQQLFPGQNPVGQVVYGMGKGPNRVIGVAENMLAPGGSPSDLGDREYQIAFYPIRPEMSWYVLRTTPEQRESVLKAAAEALNRVDDNRVINEQKTLEQMRSDYYSRDRSVVWLLVAVSVMLLAITAFGIGGLASFWVQQRTRQIGVRRALGATRRDILRYFQTENFLLAAAGIVLGMLLAFGINQWLMSKYELPRLPLMYLPIGALMLWLLGQLAVLWPALRAASIPPATATRSV